MECPETDWLGVGEMAAWLPIPGCLPIFASRFVDEALGFTIGWNYWWQLSIGVPIEVTVSYVILSYWEHTVPKAALLTIFFLAMVIINCLPVKIYGEAEFICTFPYFTTNTQQKQSI